MPVSGVGAMACAPTPKAFAVPHYLVTHPDRLVTKDTLLDAVWPETAISDAVVRIAIGELRRVLGGTAATQSPYTSGSSTRASSSNAVSAPRVPISDKPSGSSSCMARGRLT